MTLFAERLDSLMVIANVSNSMLARAISMDDSHISRLRSGKRPLPKNHPFLLPLAEYISKQIVSPAQISAIRTLTGYYGNIQDTQKFSLFLSEWMSTRSLMDQLGELSINQKTQANNKELTEPKPAPALSLPTDNDVSLFMGDCGLRESNMLFMDKIIATEEVDTVYLYSSTALDWLCSDSHYEAMWVAKVQDIIDAGKTIIVIHDLNRGIDDLVSGFKLWSPIYTKGFLASYYYPRFTSMFDNRTLLVAPPVIGLVSSSINQSNDDALVFLLEKPEAVRSLANEFNDFLSHCLPLMKVISFESKPNFFSNLYQEELEECSIMVSHEAPDFHAVPEEVLNELTSPEERAAVYTIWEQAKEGFKRSLTRLELIDMLASPEIVLARDQMPVIPFLSMLLDREVRYTKEQYLKVMERAKILATTYPNYKPYVTTDFHEGATIVTRNNAYTMVVLNEDLESPLMMTSQRLSNGVYDHFQMKLSSAKPLLDT